MPGGGWKNVGFPNDGGGALKVHDGTKWHVADNAASVRTGRLKVWDDHSWKHVSWMRELTTVVAGTLISRPGEYFTAPRDFACGDNNLDTSRIGGGNSDYGICWTVTPDGPWPTDGSSFAPDSSGFTQQVAHVIYSSDVPVEGGIDGGQIGTDTTGMMSFGTLPAGTRVEGVSTVWTTENQWAEFALLTIGTVGAFDPIEVHEWWIETSVGES